MKTYDEILKTCEENNIKPVRWYTIDNLIYLFYPDTKQVSELFNKMFVEPDTFKIYSCVCLDMNKQPSPEGVERRVIKTYSRSEAAELKKWIRERDNSFTL